MKAVYAFFIPDPKQDQQTTGHPHGKTKNIKEAISFLLPKTTKGYLKEVFQHNSLFGTTKQDVKIKPMLHPVPS
jgi:hypothetical protein